VQSYTAMRDRILKDGAIPDEYKLLTSMVTDTIAAHPDGVTKLANDARAAGATESEITEAVEPDPCRADLRRLSWASMPSSKPEGRQ
jgi:hypothetical protein